MIKNQLIWIQRKTNRVGENIKPDLPIKGVFQKKF